MYKLTACVSFKSRHLSIAARKARWHFSEVGGWTWCFTNLKVWLASKAKTLDIFLSLRGVISGTWYRRTIFQNKVVQSYRFPWLVFLWTLSRCTGLVVSIPTQICRFFVASITTIFVRHLAIKQLLNPSVTWELFGIVVRIAWLYLITQIYLLKKGVLSLMLFNEYIIFLVGELFWICQIS